MTTRITADASRSSQLLFVAAVTVTGSIPLFWLRGWWLLIYGTLLVVGLHLVLSRFIGAKFSSATPSTVIAMSSILFYSLGFIQLRLYPQSHTFVVGQYPVESIEWVLRVGILGAVALHGGAIIGEGWRPTYRQQRTRIESKRSGVDGTAAVCTAAVLSCLALGGLAATVAKFGSLRAASDAFAVHDRTVGVAAAAGVGNSAWSIFAVPAICACAVVFFTRATRRVLVVWAAFASAAIILLASITIMSARLTFVVGVLSVFAVRYWVNRRSIRVVEALTFCVAFLVLSLSVLKLRPGYAREPLALEVLKILDYAVANVAAGLNLRAQFVDFHVYTRERVGVLLLSGVPGLKPSAGEISESRLDVVVARTIGSSAQASSTGLPPSLPISMTMLFGVMGAFIALSCIGFTFGLFSNCLLSMGSSISGVYYGLIVAFAFNAFKGGDLVLDLVGEIRRWAYVGVIYLMCRIAIVIVAPQRVAKAQLEAEKHIGVTGLIGSRSSAMEELGRD